eukprot:4705652-Prymnesium_polylepis.1
MALEHEEHTAEDVERLLERANRARREHSGAQIGVDRGGDALVDATLGEDAVVDRRARAADRCRVRL